MSGFNRLNHPFSQKSNYLKITEGSKNARIALKKVDFLYG